MLLFLQIKKKKGNILKQFLKARLRIRGQGSNDFGHGPMAVPFEHVNYRLDPMKVGKSVDQLNDF